MMKRYETVFKKALDHFGVCSQKLVLMEECGELIAATSRLETQKGTIDQFIAELADVKIMIAQMEYYLEQNGLVGKVEMEVDYKMQRLLSLIMKREAHASFPGN